MSARLRVLMIEDCEDSCLLVAAEIQKHGYEPISLRVDTAPAMRRALAEQPWDVIIADCVVPAASAARVKLERSATRTKACTASMSRVFMSGQFEYEITAIK